MNRRWHLTEAQQAKLDAWLIARESFPTRKTFAKEFNVPLYVIDTAIRKAETSPGRGA